MEVSTEQATGAVSDLAAGAQEHGKDNMFTGFVLFFMIMLVLVGIWLLRVMVGKTHIKVTKILDYMRDHHPDQLKVEMDASSLSDHPVFAQWRKTSAECESISIIDVNGNYDSNRSDLCKDLVRTRIRNMRGGLEAILNKAIEFKGGFEAYFGDSQKFESRIMTTYTRVENLNRHQIVNEYEVPNHVYNAILAKMSNHNNLMAEMAQQACKRPNNYDRMYDVLTSHYAAAISMPAIVSSVVEHIKELDNVEYHSHTETTFNQMRKGTNESMNLFKNVFDPDD